ncbi:MAG: CmpA/NrtA family ABC transporter substrate-binding protein [Puniceicoccales bacterium]
MSISADNGRVLRIGLVRLLDAAPYLLAGELGYYEEAGLRVELSWELGWATIKHKLAYGTLDGAHALAPAALSIGAGYGVAPTPCRALMVTSRLGNAITLSSRIRERGVSSADDFRAEVRSSRGQRIYKLGVVAMDSCHNFLMRQWLRSIRIDPDSDVKIVVIPPGQAVRNLRAGTLDGFCVGEPWNTVAVRDGIGWCPAISDDLAPDHAEKVLLATQDRIDSRPAAFRALVGALTKACQFCDDPENHSRLARQMRRTGVLSSSAQGVEKVLRGEFDFGDGEGVQSRRIISFTRSGDTSVTASDVAWILNGAKNASWDGVDVEGLSALATETYPSPELVAG